MHPVTKSLALCCLALSILMPQTAWGHADHGAPLNDEQAIEKAVEYTKLIVAKPKLAEELALGTIDSSWQDVSETRISKKGLRYFIVALHNTSQKKTLYVLLDSFGGFNGANYSGTFEGL